MGEDGWLEFQGYLPPIKSAILVSGDQNGGSIKVEIPEIEMAALLHMMTMRGCALDFRVRRAAHPKEDRAPVDKPFSR